MLSSTELKSLLQKEMIYEFLSSVYSLEIDDEFVSQLWFDFAKTV